MKDFLGRGEKEQGHYTRQRKKSWLVIANLLSVGGW